jgi:phage-related tail fiber protein
MPGTHFDYVADAKDRFKKAVRVVTSSNITLSGLQTIDGVSLAQFERVLVRSQTTGAENGIYEVSSSAWSRTADFFSDSDVGHGMLVQVAEGTLHKSSVWMLETVGTIVVDTTALVFRCVAQPVLDRFSIPMDATAAPNSSNWAVNVAAAVLQDTVNAAFTVARFDDTTEEGRGLRINVPQRAIDIALTFCSRAQTAPAGARTVGLKWYIKSVPDGTAISGSYTSVVLSDVAISNDANFRYATQSYSLSALGLTPGLTHLVELTRINPTAGTELVGDWTLYEILVRFR